MNIIAAISSFLNGNLDKPLDALIEEKAAKINSNLIKPLDTLIEEQTVKINSDRHQPLDELIQEKTEEIVDAIITTASAQPTYKNIAAVSNFSLTPDATWKTVYSLSNTKGKLKTFAYINAASYYASFRLLINTDDPMKTYIVTFSGNSYGTGSSYAISSYNAIVSKGGSGDNRLGVFCTNGTGATIDHRFFTPSFIRTSLSNTESFAMANNSMVVSLDDITFDGIVIQIQNQYNASLAGYYSFIGEIEV